MKPFHVYLLRCADGSYYCGHTDELAASLAQHQGGAHGGTAMRRPVEMVWHGEFETRAKALAFEQQIKDCPPAEKEALIAEGGLPAKPPACSPGVSASPVVGRASSLSRHGAGSLAGMGGQSALVDGVIGAPGLAQRRAMAKAITLLESTRTDHRAQADELLTALLPHTGGALRLGISGVPGVGKSTFIESLGVYLIERGHRVAVLAIDPSSSLSGGSILGDKTRMERLSAQEAAYIRPSPSSGTLGGVAEKTREAMLVCEAAGYDVVLVETVGVGQSETAVSGMTDMFVLLQLPNAGDDLQAIKKGVMELADLVVINKADIDPAAATRARAQIQSALRMFRAHGSGEPARHDAPAWQPQVIQISGLKGEGLQAFWTAVTQFRDLQTANGCLTERRRSQSLAWMWERIDAGLKAAFRQHASVCEALPDTTQAVARGLLPPSAAARRLLALAAGPTPANAVEQRG